jgi:hypothetical protein
MEVFFSRIKEEERSLFFDARSLTELATLTDSRMAYHNTARRHSSIGYVPPLTHIQGVRAGSAEESQP